MEIHTHTHTHARMHARTVHLKRLHDFIMNMKAPAWRYTLGCQQTFYFIINIINDIYDQDSHTVYRVNNNNNNKRPLTLKSMLPAGDEHAKLKT